MQVYHRVVHQLIAATEAWCVYGNCYSLSVTRGWCFVLLFGRRCHNTGKTLGDFIFPLKPSFKPKLNLNAKSGFKPKLRLTLV